MVAGLKPARGGWMKGRAMGRNLLVHAKVMMVVVGAVEACRLLHLPVWSWAGPALLAWSRTICVAAGVLVAWNVNAFLRGAPERRERARAERGEREAGRRLASAARMRAWQAGSVTIGEASGRTGMLQAVMVQGQVSVAARPGQPSRLRYMLPPLITVTGPQAKAVVHVRACKACGDLMMLEEHERDAVCCGPCGPQGI